MNGTEDVQLQSEDMVRPISVGESQMLAFVVKILSRQDGAMIRS